MIVRNLKLVNGESKDVYIYIRPYNNVFRSVLLPYWVAIQKSPKLSKIELDIAWLDFLKRGVRFVIDGKQVDISKIATDEDILEVFPAPESEDDFGVLSNRMIRDVMAAKIEFRINNFSKLKETFNDDSIINYLDDDDTPGGYARFLINLYDESDLLMLHNISKMNDIASIVEIM